MTAVVRKMDRVSGRNCSIVQRFLDQTSRVVHGFLGGWQINGIYNWATGRPLAITTGRYNLSANIASLPNFSGERFDLSKPFDDGGRIMTVTTAQKSHFSNPGPGDPGGMPRYLLRGPGISNLDMSLFKNFKVELASTTITAQFRLELFNVLSKVNFRTPDVNINNASFGVVTNNWPARVGQIALKIMF
jgi:hypothetical protein